MILNVDYDMVRLLLALGIAFVYMLFDVFNKRNVPSMFVYGSVAIGLVATLVYDASAIVTAESILVALVICGIGYVLYKIGQLGAADFLEMAAISMLIPLQPNPLWVAYPQYGIPFIISVFIAAGVVALVLVPLYYLPKAVRRFGMELDEMVTRKNVFKGSLLFVVYGAFIIFINYFMGFNPVTTALLVIVMLSSTAAVLFEKAITDAMVEYLPVKDFAPDDMIAINLMKKRDISALRRKVGDFGMLVTPELIEGMKRMKVKDRLPVYRDAVPLALPIFLGIVISVLVGNLIILMLYA